MKGENTNGTLSTFKVVAVTIALAFVLVVSFSSTAIALNGPSSASVASFKCGLTVTQENSGNNAVQLALDAVAASEVSPPVVCVGPGVYPEQLSITSGSISLVGLGTSSNPTIIEPSSVAVNSYFSQFGDEPVAAMILVGNGGSGGVLANVNIRNIVVDGAAGSPSMDIYAACSTDYVGILYNGASGSVNNNIVKDMYMPPDQANCLKGEGIDNTIDLGYTETVMITQNVIPDYNQIGVFCGGSGVTCYIIDNDMSVYAPYNSLALSPSGVVIYPGTLATIERNTISGTFCTAGPCGPDFYTQYQGFGIQTIQSAPGTVVKDNTITNTDYGIGVLGDSVSVLSNKISNSFVSAVIAYDESGTIGIIGNQLFYSPIGITTLDDGTTFTANVASGTFNHVTTLLQITNYSPGQVIVHFRGQTYDVSGDQTISVP
jgi:hypothetical protein